MSTQGSLTDFSLLEILQFIGNGKRDSLQALLGLFLQAQGHPLPEYSQVKSATKHRERNV